MLDGEPCFNNSSYEKLKLVTGPERKHTVKLQEAMQGGPVGCRQRRAGPEAQVFISLCGGWSVRGNSQAKV